MTKMYLSVMCVILLVSQIEMAPVDPVRSLELKQDPKTIDTEAMQNVVDIEVVTVQPNNNFNSHSYMKTVLSRVKRRALSNTRHNRCANGKILLWPGGLCGSCEQYMDYHDTADCPIKP